MTGQSTLTWEGNKALEAMLVPLEALHPHPRNPRRGVVPQIAASLRRFGQQRPLLALPDGTLVAGHHVWQAAGAEGWTHIAVVQSDLTEAEVDAYLLADNRLSDLGVYDDTALAELLAPLAAADLLEGVGYTGADLRELLAFLEPAELEAAARSRNPRELPYALGEAEVYRIMLTYDQATYEALVEIMDELAEREGLDSYSAVIEELVRAAA